MYAMSPEQMHRQVVRSQEQARRQVALERQAAKAHTAKAHTTGTVATANTRDTVRSTFAAASRLIANLRPGIVRHAPVR